MSDKEVKITLEEDLNLDCGTQLKNCQISFKTYGKLNKSKTNAILICHALSGDQYCCGISPVTKKSGWWNNLVGNRKVIDTNKFFVICSNVIGGCQGSTGPSSINPQTGKRYDLSFPVITISDMVKAQVKLVDFLNIKKLFAVIGGSMGGMQALEWGASFSRRVNAIIPIATSYRHSAQNIAFHEIGRQAIMSDPDWLKGKYSDSRKIPRRGLSVARMIAHITYLSESALQRKFGRNLQKGETLSYKFDVDFQIESYLKHQGFSFVERFDANSYLYITKAMDYFDLSTGNSDLFSKFNNSKVRFCFFTFSSDWLFPTSETKTIIKSLNSCGANVSFVEVKTDKGHDAFLLKEVEFHKTLKGFLNGLEKIIFK